VIGPGTFIALVCIVVGLNLLVSVAVARYGERKGFPFMPVLIASFFLGFPIALLAVALVPARPGMTR
jgi:hypothetical protein